MLASLWSSACFLERDFSLKLKEDVVEDEVEEGAGEEAEEEEEGVMALRKAGKSSSLWLVLSAAPSYFMLCTFVVQCVVVRFAVTTLTTQVPRGRLCRMRRTRGSPTRQVVLS